MSSIACLERPASAIASSGNRQTIYRVVCYFNLFDYPVKTEELAAFSALRLDAAIAAVEELQAAGLVERGRGYVFAPGRGWMIDKRETDEAYFLRHYKKIRWAAWVLSHMPFVRGILLTGRTSKGILAEYDDFDFLILAEKDRARITWILLFLLRRLVSLNHRNANFKWFCCNYVLSEDRLALEERDPFIAMELVCAFPMFNRLLFERFRQANPWHRQYFHQRGNSLPRDLPVAFRLGLAQRLLEIPCRLFWTARVRRFVENYYRRRWLKLGMVKDEKDFREKSGDGYVKPDTGARRKFILDRVTRLDPLEHNSFLRTKIHLHRALRQNSDAPDIFLTHTALLGNKQALEENGYRVEFYDSSLDASLTALFRTIKSRFIPLVAIYADETTGRKACRMIKLFHGLGARVILSGPDASNDPQLYIDCEADVVITANGEHALPGLLEHISKGSVALESIPGIVYPGGRSDALAERLAWPEDSESLKLQRATHVPSTIRTAVLR